MEVAKRAATLKAQYNLPDVNRFAAALAHALSSSTTSHVAPFAKF